MAQLLVPGSILISKEDIANRVCKLGAQISRECADRPILLVGVLKGAAVFLSDLARAIDAPMDYDFVALSSYGGNTTSNGIVRVIKDVEASVDNKNVIIVEDIVDTGWTLRLSYLKENLQARGAAQVKICSLLDKPSRRKISVDVNYSGFEIDDKFVIGYGLDWNGLYRNLDCIWSVEDTSPAEI